ncbi:FkbM family methyltransferase [Flavobacterium sp. K77]|uniref:FkbM family methyltransferase n=1 Tax=Flavobacterium sp. K77 TaxID=2910676 RepID=UPI001F187DB8|nr:FkbM family methyltransferase [Flavobacterium sp. K77]MCF6139763.1 FkbM family methyltransferase [Flavobacterium sp. K77]
MRYSTLIKQLFIVVKSRWVLQLVQGKIFSLASFEVVSNLKKTVPHIDTIIDVGANSGQFSNVATHLYPKAKLHAFEPLPDLYKKIAKKFKSNTNITTYNLALGNEDGAINFNKNKYGHISSILNISTTNIHYPNQENDLSQIEVQIKKLDALALTSASENKVVLLKLDVQGYELEVLKGAEASLKNIEYIIIEANLEQLYTNQPSFAEMNAYLMGIGFELSGMLDFNLGRSNKYIEVDFLYKKTTTKQ